MYREETELQIKLAELQADIQIYLAVSIGLFAAVFAVAALVFSMPSAPFSFANRVVIAIILVVIEFVMAYYATKFVKKMLASRNELRKLKEKYVW